MSSHFLTIDDSSTSRIAGCAPDFLVHLATHQAFLNSYFELESKALDYSFESVKWLDDLLKAAKQKQQTHPRALVDGLIAYCGEVLRFHRGGEWFLLVAPADRTGSLRYFPSITTLTGQLLDFAAMIEDDFTRSLDSRLYHRIKMLGSPKVLPVQEWTVHPLGDCFPPLKISPKKD